MRLSIIVCTMNRAHALKPCFESIEKSIKNAKLPTSDAEIIFVNNNSTDNTQEILETFKEQSLYPLKAIIEKNAGSSAARNCGVKNSQGNLLIFIDDDCVLDKTHVSETLRLDSSDNVLVIRGGKVELGDPTDLPLTIQTNPNKQTWQKDTPCTTRFGGGSILGCNISVRKKAFDIIGGFDEKLGPGKRIPAAEDTDFFYKGYMHGITLEYNPQMIVYHYHGRKKTEVAHKLIKNYVIGTGGLYGKYGLKHPKIQDRFIKKTGALSPKIKTDHTKSAPITQSNIDSFGLTKFEKIRYAALGAIQYIFWK